MRSAPAEPSAVEQATGEPRPAAPALILASRSPRRREALAALGLAFEVVASDVESRLGEQHSQGDQLDPANPVPVALAKALDVAAAHPHARVLAGDTIVVLDGQALGKPESPAHAREMLRALRGRTHVVRTGLALVHAGHVRTAEVRCPLAMRAYSDEEIEQYIATGEPFDCAGAYDVHRLGGALVECVEGCFSAVVGLPIVQAARLLAAAGVLVPRDPAATCTALYGRRCLAARTTTAPACLDAAAPA